MLPSSGEGSASGSSEPPTRSLRKFTVLSFSVARRRIGVKIIIARLAALEEFDALGLAAVSAQSASESRQIRRATLSAARIAMTSVEQSGSLRQDARQPARRSKRLSLADTS